MQQVQSQRKRSELSFHGPKGPSAFYFFPEENELVKEQTSFFMRPLLNENSHQQNSKRSEFPKRYGHISKKTRSYIKKNIHHPIKLFRRVLDILKKDRKKSSKFNPPNFYLIPSELFTRHNAKVKKTFKHGKRKTDIDTRRYHISIIEKSRKGNLKDHGNVVRRSEFVTAVTKGNNSDERVATETGSKRSIESQMLNLVLKKLHSQTSQLDNRDKILANRQNTGRVILNAVENSKKETHNLLEDISKRQEKRKRLTNLFVRFMEDLTHKLNLDPLTIADMLARRASSKRSHVIYRAHT